MTLSIGRVAFSIVFASLLLAGSLSASSPQSSGSNEAGHKQASGSKANTQQSLGEQKFNQNCSRCHRSPEGFPSRISGTILRHMRVRASLSQQDEREILHFLNP